MGGSLSNFEDMPQPTAITPEEKLSRTFAEELFTREDQVEIVSENEPKLNKSQANMLEEIYQAVLGNNIDKSFVVNSPVDMVKPLHSLC